MEANGCVQRLDLVEIFTMSMLKLKNDIKSASRLPSIVRLVSGARAEQDDPLMPVLYVFGQHRAVDMSQSSGCSLASLR